MPVSLSQQTIVADDVSTVVVESGTDIVPVTSSTIPFQKKRLLPKGGQRHARDSSEQPTNSHTSFTYNYTPLASPIDSLRTSPSYSSSIYYRQVPPTTSASWNFKDALPLPDFITRTYAYTLLEPFLFPLLFPLGVISAAVQSIMLVLPIIPLAILAGVAGSIVIPLICLGGMSLAGFAVLKAALQVAERQARMMLKMGVTTIAILGRVGQLVRGILAVLKHLASTLNRKVTGEEEEEEEADYSDYEEEEEKKVAPTKRSQLKPGPSILKPPRPLPLFEQELPPIPPTTPTRMSFTPTTAPNKAKTVFQSRLLAEREAAQEHQDATLVQASPNLSIDTTVTPAKPPSPYGVLDIPPYRGGTPKATEEGGNSPVSPSYFTTRLPPSLSMSETSTAASSSYAPTPMTPRTPGSPLVMSSTKARVVKRVRIVDPATDGVHADAVVHEAGMEIAEEYAYGDDPSNRPFLRDFASGKLHHALEMLQTSNDQVWGGGTVS